ncbi:hypothetical protein O181_115563 [Austropuccinia psidii MF-1]|uniref:Uncharacterized protein n=1 Tax=Austropuccinia psidii MF-1 TaxID=1389203 RepID=A0A9Q3K6T0_9BASI|nr:hypothetical protein [Austropuccinia psidii MF-1]
MRLQHFPHLCPHHSLCFRTPASLSPWLTILTLQRGPQVMPLTQRSPPLRLLAPAQHASDAAYHPYACSSLLTCLQHPPHTGLILTLLLPPQDGTMIPPPITPAFSSLPLKILTLPQRPQDMLLRPPSTPLTPNPLCRLPSLC